MWPGVREWLLNPGPIYGIIETQSARTDLALFIAPVSFPKSSARAKVRASGSLGGPQRSDTAPISPGTLDLHPYHCQQPALSALSRLCPGGTTVSHRATEQEKDVPLTAHKTSGSQTEGQAILCPKCQTRNPPDLSICRQCGATLLPGRRIRDRIGYLIGGVTAAVLLLGSAWLFARMEMADALPPICASPQHMAFAALVCLGSGLAFALGRTPQYEKYLQRAQRHTEASPDQALADFSRALQLAPDKEKADVLKQRGALHLKLGHREAALADLSVYAASPYAHKGAEALTSVLGIEMEDAAKAMSSAERSIQQLRKELTAQGVLVATGYCRRCKDAVRLDGSSYCPRCGRRIKQLVYVNTHQVEAQMTKWRDEANARRKKRKIVLIVAGVSLLACALCAGISIWSARTKERPEATASVGTGAVRTPTTATTGHAEPSAPTSPPPPSPTPTAPPTATPLPDAVVSVEALNLRTGPGTAFERVGLLREGEVLEVVARSEAGDWLVVTTTEGVEGWVSASYVTLGIPVQNIPLATEVPPLPTPSGPTPTPLPPVDAEIAKIAGGDHGEISQPGEVGGIAAGGEAEVTIVNDTPYELTILAGSPNSVTVTIEACTSCKVYSFVGPVFCSKEGRMQVSVRLKPGTFQVAARVNDPGVIPFLGIWELKGDTSYFNCFYIVRR